MMLYTASMKVVKTPLVAATFEHGIFKPVGKIHLPEHMRVILAITPATDDIPTMLLDQLAEQSESFDFLSDSREDIYTLEDGKACH